MLLLKRKALYLFSEMGCEEPCAAYSALCGRIMGKARVLVAPGTANKHSRTYHQPPHQREIVPGKAALN